jgi:zinc D-Ala-D-Ala carboxypeptidase
MRYVCLLLLAACLIPVLGGEAEPQPEAPVRLDPKLERAVKRATRAAAREGITIQITSGVRTRAYQQQLLDEAIETYGSEAVARQYVNTPDRSTHVKGLAVDVGPTDAAYWMAQHGAEYGLCQIYANEIWHYERVIEPGGTCPEPLPDASG